MVCGRSQWSGRWFRFPLTATGALAGGDSNGNQCVKTINPNLVMKIKPLAIIAGHPHGVEAAET